MQVLRRLRRSIVIPLVLVAVTASAQADPPTVLYRLSGDSGFVYGCIEGECRCAVFFVFMGGTFGLTPDPAQGPEVFEVSDIRWFTHWNGQVIDVITGSGTYTIDGDHHQIVLELQVNGGDPITVDSGLVARDSELPGIVISGLTDTFCFQQGVSLDAAPSAYSVDLTMASTTELTWTVVPDASTYDVVEGDLNWLRESGGAFDEASTACVASQVPATSAMENTPLLPGEAVWFLVRGVPGPGYDSGGAGQVGSRDDEIGESASSCP